MDLLAGPDYELRQEQKPASPTHSPLPSPLRAVRRSLPHCPDVQKKFEDLHWVAICQSSGQPETGALARLRRPTACTVSVPYPQDLSSHVCLRSPLHSPVATNYSRFHSVFAYPFMGFSPRPLSSPQQYFTLPACECLTHRAGIVTIGRLSKCCGTLWIPIASNSLHLRHSTSSIPVAEKRRSSCHV